MNYQDRDGFHSERQRFERDITGMRKTANRVAVAVTIVGILFWLAVITGVVIGIVALLGVIRS